MAFSETPSLRLSSPMAGFAAARLAPILLLLLGAISSAGWLLAALLYLTVFSAVTDRITARPGPEGTGDAEFPASDALLAALAVTHLALMPLAVWMIGGDSDLTFPARLVAFLAFGLYFGQISNPAAHELIHRGDRRLYGLGVAVYVTLLFGHHASAHRHVHHRHVATPADPNTARRGESFYAFAPRAWIGSFRAGLVVENARRRGGLHPYLIYVGGAVLCMAAATTFGAGGLPVYVALAGHATAQLLLSDYVQHYGLTRTIRPDGRPEPVSDCHSWNAAHRFSATMMLNAPRHSDHHAHPTRAYPALRLPATAPTLPGSLPVMATVALVPALWRRMMHPRLAQLGASREREDCGAGAGPVDLAG